MQQFVFESSYTFHYNTPNPVPIRDAIDSLVGLEKVLATLPRVTKRLINIDNFKIQVAIEEIYSGSLTEKILVKYIFDSEEDLDAFIAKVKKIMPPNVLVPILVAGVLAYGAHLLMKPAPGNTVTVGDITNSVVNIGGTQTIPAEAAQAIIDGVRNKKEIAGAAIEVFRPAKGQPGSSLSISGGTVADGDTADLEFTSQHIAKTPDALHHDPVEVSVDLKHVIVDIRAIELDNTEKGWEGRIEGVTGRIRIEFDAGVDAAAAARKQKLNADVTLTSRYRGSQSEPKPYSMLIKKIY